ncbi:hypothetical protein LCGC14_0909120, partial [marine sediment metagenome]
MWGGHWDWEDDYSDGGGKSRSWLKRMT